MTGSVKAAKTVAKEVAAKDVVAEPAKKTAEAKPSPAVLLKQAVSGKEAKPSSAVPARKPVLSPRNARYAALAAGALVVGTAFGMVTAPKPSSIEALAGIHASLEASRAEASRLSGEIEKLGKSLATMREASEAARGESRSLGAGVYERLTTLEQGFEKKIAGLGETIERAGREQTAKLANLTTSAEKRAAAPAVAPTVTPSAAVLPAAKTEPTHTGTISESKPKSEIVEGWALRDVYAGVAMLEDRKRRLVEVGPGDVVPGVGRVEAVERRGRAWVVVTKQGIITPQAW